MLLNQELFRRVFIGRKPLRHLELAQKISRMTHQPVKPLDESEKSYKNSFQAVFRREKCSWPNKNGHKMLLKS